MVSLTASVGPTGQNRKHDVALVQAMIKVSSYDFIRDLYPGVINGVYDQALTDALIQIYIRGGKPSPQGVDQALSHLGGLPIRVENNSAMLRLLHSLMPGNLLDNMTAIPGTALVLLPDNPVPNARIVADGLEGRAPLLKAEEVGLSNVIMHIARTSGLVLDPVTYGIEIHTGQFSVLLKPKQVKRVNNHTGRVTEGALTLDWPTIIGAMLETDSIWKAVLGPADKKEMVKLVSVANFPELKGMTPLSQKELLALNWSEKPEHYVIEAAGKGLLKARTSLRRRVSDRAFLSALIRRAGGGWTEATERAEENCRKLFKEMEDAFEAYRIEFEYFKSRRDALYQLLANYEASVALTQFEELKKIAIDISGRYVLDQAVDSILERLFKKIPIVFVAHKVYSVIQEGIFIYEVIQRIRASHAIARGRIDKALNGRFQAFFDASNRLNILHHRLNAVMTAYKYSSCNIYDDALPDLLGET